MKGRTDPPRFFLDRGLGSRIVPGGLRAAGWTVTTMDERYGFERSQSIPDVEWIIDATGLGECLLTKDIAIATRAPEARIVVMNDARLFALANARLTGPESLGQFLRNEQAIFRWAARVKPPFAAAIYEHGVRRRTLRYP